MFSLDFHLKNVSPYFFMVYHVVFFKKGWFKLSSISACPVLSTLKNETISWKKVCGRQLHVYACKFKIPVCASCREKLFSRLLFWLLFLNSISLRGLCINIMQISVGQARAVEKTLPAWCFSMKMVCCFFRGISWSAVYLKTVSFTNLDRADWSRSQITCSFWCFYLVSTAHVALWIQ